MVYLLEARELLRYIPEPFIPERREFFSTITDGVGQRHAGQARIGTPAMTGLGRAQTLKAGHAS
jgi:hypothetical protein